MAVFAANVLKELLQLIIGCEFVTTKFLSHSQEVWTGPFSSKILSFVTPHQHDCIYNLDKVGFPNPLDKHYLGILAQVLLNSTLWKFGRTEGFATAKPVSYSLQMLSKLWRHMAVFKEVEHSSTVASKFVSHSQRVNQALAKYCALLRKLGLMVFTKLGLMVFTRVQFNKACKHKNLLSTGKSSQYSSEFRLWFSLKFNHRIWWNFYNNWKIYQVVWNGISLHF